jgi:hypothetical protein
MIKKCLFAVGLLSLALASGCAKGGNGLGNGITVAVSDGNLGVFYVTQVVQFTAKVTGTSNTAVTWTLSNNGTDCTANPTLCGSIDGTGKYTAPSTAPPSPKITVQATSQADTTKSDSLTVSVLPISVQLTPSPVSVGVGFTEQFTAVAVPDDAPQKFDWSIANCPSSACGSVDANGLYSAPPSVPSDKFTVQATSQLDPADGVANAKVTIVASRLPSGTYAFRSSGFNATGAIAVTGNFISKGDGTLQSGVEDELTTGGWVHRVIDASTSSYTLNSNNQGTITLNASGPTSNTYTMVLDASGDIRTIESTNGTNRHGSGVIEPVALAQFKDNSALNGTFVFGFSGVDLSGKRVGYVGLLSMNGTGGITGGLLDTNDNGGGTNGTPLNVAGTSTYTMSNGVGTMTLTINSQSFTFALYGATGAKSASNPLTLYAISTKFDAVQPAISGSLVLQDSTETYSNGALKGTAVVNLTGVDSTGTNTNVSLTLATTDGSGNISGTFDQNNAGTITGPAQSFGTGYKYSAAGCSNCGRYTINLLGNPTANPPVPMQFILYASGANRGFLLDQSTTSVITGTMVPQKIPPDKAFSASLIASSYAAATADSGTTGVDPIAANLLLTWVNTGACTAQCVNGTQYDVSNPSGVTVTGANPAYKLNGTGDGTITLTAPTAQSYAIYAIDVSHFLMMDVDKSNTQSSIIFAQQ